MEMTASYIRTEVGDSLSGVYTSIQQTASEIRADVWAAESSLYSYVELTASNIRTEVGNAESGLYTSIEQTASSIRADVWASESSVYSYLEMTASYIRTEVGDSLSGVYTSIQQTASEIRADVWAAESSVYSYVQITASSIKSEVGDSLSGVYTSITQSASSIRADVWASQSAMYAYVEITASRIRSEVASADSGLYNYIEQTSSSISAVVTDMNELRQSGLWINRDSIELVVNSISVNDVYVQDTNGEYMRTGWDSEKGEYIYELAPSGYTGDLYRLDQNANIGDALHVTDEYVADSNGDYLKKYDINLGQYVYELAPSGYTGQRYRHERNVHVNESVGLKIDKLVDGSVASFGVYDANNLTAGYMISMINGQSTATIQADKINLEGYVKASDITADFLAAKIATIPTLNGIAASFTGNVSTTSGVLASEVYVGGSGSYQAVSNAVKTIANNANAPSGQFGIVYTTLGGSLQTVNFNVERIVSASVSGDTLTLVPSSGEAITFRKSVSLSGAWNGTTVAGKYYTVTATMGSSSAVTQSSGAVTATIVPVYNQSTHVYDISYGAVSGLETLYTNSDTTGTEAYDAGWAAARAMTGLSISGNALQYLYPSATVGQYGIQTKYITATSVLTYDSTEHTYTATAGAAYDGTVVNTDSDTSGTEAYEDGVSSVSVSSRSGWVSGCNVITLSNGVTEEVYMPAPNDATWTSYRQGTNLLVYCTAGGREYSHTFTI